MNYEQPPQSEFSESEQTLIRLLRERGPSDSETRELLMQWTIQGENEANVANSLEANIAFTLRRARLYAAAGFHDEALENFEAARLQAEYAKSPEPSQSIEDANDS